MVLLPPECWDCRYIPLHLALALVPEIKITTELENVWAYQKVISSWLYLAGTCSVPVEIKSDK
jgi:hypothetical protein